eukprot:TRINITY_DN74331_c0_g1_i4.p1 TRINITY_DN74331_c0_g1~~TRINITY_DN74331_c0_g1_i4.p1  ORF type:complete len:356 (+),score=13.91 TRINITY_DN74331_c0_g1_i4:275-1342(+)
MGARIRRGMIRFLELMVDLSRYAGKQDFKPNRAMVVLGVVQQFIRDFFDQNPLSQLGLIALRDGQAERITELSGSPESHIMKLKENQTMEGVASLQNGLSMAMESLSTIPPYGHREVLILYASFTTCDPGDLMKVVQQCKGEKITVSIVGLCAEVFICKQVCKESGGRYHVAKDESHLEELVRFHSLPPPTSESQSGSSLVHMGFPKGNPEGALGVCFMGRQCSVQSGGYICPRCCACNPDLPCECHICGLTLVSSPHLARSYHHLFPIEAYEEVVSEGLVQGCQIKERSCKEAKKRVFESCLDMYCFGCLSSLSIGQGGVVVSCKGCGHVYCFDCDAYVHENLHNCPGCENLRN